MNKLNTGFCSCGHLYRMVCQGVCKELHTKPEGVVCGELYFFEPSQKQERREKRPKIRSTAMNDKERARQRYSRALTD